MARARRLSDPTDPYMEPSSWRDPPEEQLMECPACDEEVVMGESCECGWNPEDNFVPPDPDDGVETF